MAAATQMQFGKTLYRDVWFDKPPLLASINLAWAVRTRMAAAPGRGALRAAGLLRSRTRSRAIFGRPWRVSGPRALLGFFLIFDFPSAVIPLAADLTMLAPHLAAVWLAYRGRAFWSGAMAGVAMLINTKALFVLAACAVWCFPAIGLLAAGFAAVNVLAAVMARLDRCAHPLHRPGLALGLFVRRHDFPRTSGSRRRHPHSRLAGISRRASSGGLLVAPAIPRVRHALEVTGLGRALACRRGCGLALLPALFFPVSACAGDCRLARHGAAWAQTRSRAGFVADPAGALRPALCDAGARSCNRPPARLDRCRHGSGQPRRRAPCPAVRATPATRYSSGDSGPTCGSTPACPRPRDFSIRSRSPVSRPTGT